MSGNRHHSISGQVPVCISYSIRRRRKEGFVVAAMSLSLLSSSLIGCRGRVRLLLLAITLVHTCQLSSVAAGEHSIDRNELKASFTSHELNGCVVAQRYTVSSLHSRGSIPGRVETRLRNDSGQVVHTHVSHVCTGCFYRLRQVRRIRWSLAMAWNSLRDFIRDPNEQHRLFRPLLKT